MLTGNQELIRDINSRLVLTHIINNGPISRATLAKALGLTKATISTIVQTLIEKNLILELGSDNTSRGRKPILLTFNPNCGYVLSIDLDWDYLTFMTCHLEGQNYEITRYPNHKTESEIIDYISTLIEKHIDRLPPTPHGVIGISLAIHGVTYHNQITFMPYSPYAGIDFVSLLQNHFDIPIYLENEANLSVIGEKIFCYSYPNMAGISVHSGIGLGLIINHELFCGYNGNAGEFGHTIVEVNGKPCPCGNLGCFEQYASERALLLEYMDKKQLSDVTIMDLIAAYQNHDPVALELISQFTQYMAIGINNILNMFNPDVIVINSTLVNEIPSLLDLMTSLLKNRIKDFCHLVPSKLQDTSTLLGGVCICIQGFLGLNSLNFRINHSEH